MARTSRMTASAIIGGLVLLGSAGAARAQRPTAVGLAPYTMSVPAPAGIDGTVHNEQGHPIPGVVVSVIGETTTFAVTDDAGRFEIANLAPGPYIVRAHCRGYVTPKTQTVAVRARVRTASTIAMRRADAATPTILAAGIGPAVDALQPSAEPVDVPTEVTTSTGEDDHSETAWRLRHVRRGVLREVSVPADVLAENDRDDESVAVFLGRAVSSPARVATSFFADTPFSGQVNLLTTNSFDTPDQLLSGAGLAHGIAYVSVGAPVGDNADWTVRGALTEADIASWTVAGAYRTRGAARHAYDVGMSYSTQHYAGGNPLALRDVSDGTRNAGTVYGYETFTIAPRVAVTYGATYARYDYLDRPGLFSPRAAVALKPFRATRLTLAVSSRADAPGAAEFMPPSNGGIWLPPQRTFSSAQPRRPMQAERTMQVDSGLERDFGVATIGVRAFRQQVDHQMVTVFGTDVQGLPNSGLGHYVIGVAGDADTTGGSVAIRSPLGSRIRGAVTYTTATASMTPAVGRYLIVLAPSAIRHQTERLQDVTSSIEADVPETSTRVFILYRVGNGYARPADLGDATLPRVDSRFDVQVRQSLPFLNFTSARWEMLVAVSNFFRETEPDQSVYDELLTVRPPKRIVGGVTLHF